MRVLPRLLHPALIFSCRLAAHFDKKLTKSQIFTCDIVESVDSVLNPSAPLALRVSGHLMLGIVRIYSRKVKYLMADCTEAMWKVSVLLLHVLLR